QGSWRRALNKLARAAKSDVPMVPLVIEAVRARATVGEICDTLRGVWGTYDARA
ncbi:MAG: methylmalonyl-CoA mutase family protein, partial [Gemmatimonadales bacterium]